MNDYSVAKLLRLADEAEEEGDARTAWCMRQRAEAQQEREPKEEDL